MPDDKFDLPIAQQPDLNDRTEAQDRESLQRELHEQERISREQVDPHAHNKVPGPGEGVGGRVRVNRDHWGTK